jgi:short-subunit dehydrogenase
VTGATSDLGTRYATGLAERGYDLLLVGRDRDALDAVARTVARGTKVEVDTLLADFAEPKDLARVEQRIANDPAITALINNAGSATFGTLAKLSSDAVDQMIAVNITATTRLTRAVLPGLLSRGAGSIVNFASVLAFHPWAEFGAYSAAKAYVVSFSQAVQGEVAGKGVLVQVIAPPAADTSFWTKAGLPVGNLPAGAVMKPGDVVAAALRAWIGANNGYSPRWPIRPFGTITRRRARHWSVV